MATETQRNRFLLKTGSSSATFGNTEIDDIFLEAAENYPAGSDAVLMAWSVVEGFDRILAQVAKLTSYTQNASSESRGQIHDHLLQDRKNAKEKLDEVLAADLGAPVRFGSYGGRGVPPTRRKEYPDA